MSTYVKAIWDDEAETAIVEKFVKDNKMTKEDIRKYIRENFGEEWLKGMSNSTKSVLTNRIVTARMGEHFAKDFDNWCKSWDEKEKANPTPPPFCVICKKEKKSEEMFWECRSYTHTNTCSECKAAEDKQEQEFIDAFKEDDFEKCKEMFLAKKNKVTHPVNVVVPPDEYV